MKLNHECVRELLLWLEENLPLAGGYQLQYNEIEHSKQDICYSAQLLIDAGFLEGKVTQLKLSMPIVFIRKISWEGHKFIDNIRSNTAWNKSVDAATKVGGASLSLLAQIASQVVAAKLEGYL